MLWQVLLPFNLLARLLPSNPTEEDMKPLRRSMQRVSSRALLQTDLEFGPHLELIAIT